MTKTQLFAMLRSGGAGSLSHVLRNARPSIRAFSTPTARSTPRPLRPSSLALTTYKRFTTSLQRYQTSDSIDIKHEKEVANKPLEQHPDQVSSVSSVHQVFHEQGAKEEDKGEDMLAGIKGDWVSAYLRLSGPMEEFPDPGDGDRKSSRQLLHLTRFRKKRSTLVSLASYLIWLHRSQRSI